MAALGEIAIGDVPVAEGYFSKKNNKNAFVTDINNKDTQMYLTGDQGMMYEDGMIMFLGRGDSQVQVRGQRVELNEVNSVLKQLSGVTNVYVFAEDGVSGIEIKAALAMDKPETIQKMHKIIRNALPDYMCPADLVIVKDFPVNSNAKIDQTKIKVLFEKPSIETTQQDRIEPQITALWAEVLKHNDFSTKCNFFDVGGNSLKLLALQGKIKQRYQIYIKLTDFFSLPTVEAQAQMLENKRSNFGVGYDI